MSWMPLRRQLYGLRASQFRFYSLKSAATLRKIVNQPVDFKVVLAARERDAAE